MALTKGYDINSPDGFGMYVDTIYSTPELAEVGFKEWILRFGYQGYYRDSNRNMIPLNELRQNCKLVEFEFDSTEFDGEFI
jgi:hypothetical protein